VEELLETEVDVNDCGGDGWIFLNFMHPELSQYRRKRIRIKIQVIDLLGECDCVPVKQERYTFPVIKDGFEEVI
jgi:hypothetical protein